MVLVAAPLAWFVDLVAKWMIVPGAHEPGGERALYAITGGALVVAIAAAVVSGFEVRRVRGHARFVAEAAVVLSIVSIVLIVATAVPTLILEPGDEP